MKTTFGTIAVMLSLSIFFNAASQLKPEQQGRGGQWLSWHTDQRDAYVRGYIDGYQIGFGSACQSADELFEKDKPHRLRDGNRRSDQDFPSLRCLDRRGEFSHVAWRDDKFIDVSAYTNVVTAFYEHHSECRDFPFVYLLKALGLKYVSADRLHQLASSGSLKGTETRAREWCSADAAPSQK